jgi:transposase
VTNSGGLLTFKNQQMATIQEFEKMSVRERRTRYFSNSFKQKKVSEIERNLVTISELCAEYQVSRTAVYQWIYKFSKMRKKKEKQVVESKSDTRKIAELQQKIKDLERLVGQKQVEVEFLNKMIELTEEDLNIDIKKKGSFKPSSGTGPGAKL